MPKNNDDIIHICKAVDIYVSRSEWMGKFGKAITERGIVPEVALEKTAVKALEEGMSKHGLTTLEIK